MVVCQGTQQPTERALNGQTWSSVDKKINKIVLYYDLKYKINTHEFVLI